MRNWHTVLVEKSEGKSVLEITRCRSENNIKTNLDSVEGSYERINKTSGFLSDAGNSLISHAAISF